MNLQDSYASMHAEAMALLAKIEEKLNDLPAPDTDGLNWGHVGDLGNLVHQLKNILGEE